MRLLYLCPEYPPAPSGGIGAFYQTLAEAAARGGVAVAVVAAGCSGFEPLRARLDGVAVLRAPASGQILGDRLRFRHAARREIERFRPNVVETYDWSGPVPWKPAAPLVVRMHGAARARGDWLGRRTGRLLGWCEQRTLAAADALVAVSHWIGRRTAASFTLPGRWSVLPNGVDIRLFSPGPRAPAGREILYVGSVREDKGVGLLLDAFAIVARRLPDAVLRLTGPLPGAGLAERFLHERLSRLAPPLRARICFDGRQPRELLPELYRQAALCVFPSSGEAQGLACLEAMSCGAAVAANAAGGMAEMVDHGISGLLVDSRDPAVWAEALEEALVSPERARALGRAARRRVESCFSLDQMVERNLRLYEAVASGRTVAA